MTGVDMDGDILSPLLSAPVWDDTLCFFPICPPVNNAIEPAAMILFCVLEKKLLQDFFFCLSVALAVVVLWRDVHLSESVGQTAQVKAKPEITGCTYCCISICIFMKDEKCKCRCSSSRVLETVWNSNITLNHRMHYNVFHHLFPHFRVYKKRNSVT